MTGRMSRNNKKRKISHVHDVCDSLLGSKKRAHNINEPLVSMRMEFFSFFDKNQPMHTLTKVEFIAVNGPTDSKRSSQHMNVVSQMNACDMQHCHIPNECVSNSSIFLFS